MKNRENQVSVVCPCCANPMLVGYIQNRHFSCPFCASILKMAIELEGPERQGALKEGKHLSLLLSPMNLADTRLHASNVVDFFAYPRTGVLMNPT